MTRFLISAATLLVATTLAVASAQAASFTIWHDTCNNKEKGCTLVAIMGPIEANDGGKFLELMWKNNVKKAFIGLNSEGGNVTAALQIGRYIRANDWATFVPSEMLCGSACAMIWLAGTYRQAHETSRIGFHAAHTIAKMGKQTYAIESGQANAIVGAYYQELGLSEDAIRFFTKAAPNSATWLTTEIAARLGVKLTMIPKEKK
jgi:hypothetical protein